MISPASAGVAAVILPFGAAALAALASPAPPPAVFPWTRVRLWEGPAGPLAWESAALLDQGAAETLYELVQRHGWPEAPSGSFVTWEAPHGELRCSEVGDE